LCEREGSERGRELMILCESEGSKRERGSR